MCQVIIKSFEEYRILDLSSFDVKLILIRLSSTTDRIIIIRRAIEGVRCENSRICMGRCWVLRTVLNVINFLTKLLEKRGKESLINTLFPSHVGPVKLIELVVLIPVPSPRAFKLSRLARRALWGWIMLARVNNEVN